MVYLQLFISFFKIGLFGFGGGYAMLSLIQHEVEQHGWLTSAQFTDIVAISQMTPGPIGINCATYVGYTATNSVFGSVIATTAILLPSFIIMILISRIYIKLKDNKYISGILISLRPVVIGLIAAAALVLITPDNFIDAWSVLLFAFALLLTVAFKMHPIAVICFAGLAGYIIYT